MLCHKYMFWQMSSVGGNVPLCNNEVLAADLLASCLQVPSHQAGLFLRITKERGVCSSDVCSVWLQRCV